MKILSSLFLLLMVANSFAIHRGGNGGDAVVCGDQVYMLDYVEAYGTDTSFEKTGTI